MQSTKRLFLLICLVHTMVFKEAAASTRVAQKEQSLRGQEKTHDLLPRVEEWPHRPVLIQTADDTRVRGYTRDEPIPIGVPVEFESSLFKGRILIRLRNAKSDDPTSHNAYFEGRKRVKQVIIQGQFKEPLKMSEVYHGDIFEKPLNPAPPHRIGSIIKRFIRSLSPGVIVDLASNKPRVLELLAGGAHSLSIDRPGQQPNMLDVDVPENTALLGRKYKSADKRRKELSTPIHASNYSFDTDHIYTFHSHDNVLDLGTYFLQVPILGSFDMTRTLDGQPMSISAVTKDDRFLFRFHVWHERLLASEKAEPCCAE